MPLVNSRPIVSTPTIAETTGLPARGLPASGSVHLVVLATIFLLSLAPVIRDGPLRVRQRYQRMDIEQPQTSRPILPNLQSSSASASSPGAASARSAPGRNAASSASSMALLHTGPQHIISNTPDATNSVQTILQPDLPHPPRLATALPIPSIVRLAAGRQMPTLSAPKLTAIVTPALPRIQPSTVDTVALTSATELADTPKLAAFATRGRSYDAPKPPPAPPAVAKPAAPAVVAKSAPAPPSTATPAGGTDNRNLLVVNSMEVQSTLSEHDIPAAELHGRFEVFANPNVAELHSTGGTSTTAGVSGSGTAASGTGAGKGHAASASGSGADGPHGKGSGGGTSEIAGSGSSSGRGIGNGGGLGSGHTSGAGMGNGNGSSPAGGNGSAPFSGMTIVGGSGGNALRSAPSDATVDPNNPHGAYGLSILSNAGSGGAVRDFGVFNDGPVYTVYLDVSKLGIRGSRWSLQYSASREVRIAHPGVALTPPFAEDQRLPQLPPAAVAANIGRVVVIQANLKADGKLEAFHVMESPDQRLNGGLVESLTHWYFEPAAMGSEKVAVKVLLGIPIASAMADNGISQQADRTPPAAVSRSAAQ
ncbi:MAG TPA: hypothetical protein VFW30_11510 [Bryocella sp.]|nr:hypothetical protein [Bryocella sp.]